MNWISPGWPHESARSLLTDSLDEHDIISGGLAQDHRFVNAARDTAESAGIRRLPDVGTRVAREFLHPCEVTQQ
jgi:hypothetical protein